MLMTAESKLYIGVVASMITGFLVSIHAIDPSQADTVGGYLQTLFGGILLVLPALIGLEGLLFKHKAVVTQTITNQSAQEKPTNTPPAPTAQ